MSLQHDLSAQQVLAQQVSQLPDEHIAQHPRSDVVIAAAVIVHIEATSIAASIHTFVFIKVLSS
ncbi:MAG TPA: hypothetical protein VK798_07130 [Alloacidobacterium sp.]|nr:hypothetical protein [Alloacidobacterium sp.]